MYKRQQLSDWQILQVILPKCKPPLRDRVLESLNSTLPVEELHTTIIKYFIPTGIYEEIKRNTVLRVQGAHERLAHYIADIRESSRLLQVDWTEKQLVDTILVGLSPEERSRLALISRPLTFADLEQCSVHSSNVWYADPVSYTHLFNSYWKFVGSLDVTITQLKLTPYTKRTDNTIY